MSTPSKYEKAVHDATNKNNPAALAKNDPGTTIDLGKSEVPITKFDQSKIGEMINSGEWEFAPMLRKIKEGEMIAGILEGNGPDAHFERVDKLTGVITTTVVQTWIIASPDGSQRASILSSAQLDRKLPPFVGVMVRIARGEDLQLANGHRCSDYMVAGTRMPEGKRRNWATLPAAGVQAQLPAASAIDEEVTAANGVAAS